MRGACLDIHKTGINKSNLNTEAAINNNVLVFTIRPYKLGFISHRIAKFMNITSYGKENDTA